MDWRLKQAVLTDDRATLIELLQTTGISSNTLLHLAARNGRVEMVKEIIRLRPEMVVEENKKLETPLHEACRGGNDEVVRLLLAANSSLSVISKFNSENQDPLIIASSFGDLRAVNALLDLTWFSIKVEDLVDSTPLHIAASKGYTDIARKLVEKCPLLARKMDKNGLSPLHCACNKGHFEVSKLLLRLDPYLALLYDNSGYAPVHLVVMNGDAHLLEEFLISAPFSFQLLSTKQGETVFHLSVRFDKFDAFLYLAKVLNDTNLFHQADNFGNTITSLALYGGRPQFADYISCEARLQINHQNGKKGKKVNILDADGASAAQKDIVDKNSAPASSPKDGSSRHMHPAYDQIGRPSSAKMTTHQLDIIPDIGKEMAGSIMVAVLEGIIKRALSLAAEEVTFAWGYKKGIKKLARRLETVQALLSCAECKKLSAETTQPWLRRIKAVAVYSDNFLGEITYEVFRRKVEINIAIGNKLHNFSLVSGLKRACKIKKINSRIDKICRYPTEKGFSAVEEVNHPCIDDSEVEGREGDISEVVRFLLSSGFGEDLPIISIVGAPGQGKTTVAQQAYKNVNVIRHFDRRIWMSVSDDIEVKRLLNKVMSKLTDVEGKKYLVVLDDLRSEVITGEWVSLADSLIRTGGSRESKIMITTRVVDPSMHVSVTYRLAGLSEDNSWTIFERRAFAEGGVTRTLHLEAIAKRMVKCCRGSPLAVHDLGTLMYSKKSESEWLSIENSPLLESPEDSILPTLISSCSYLPSPCLKHCFSYCSIFPKDSHIYKNELVQIWMALGLLHPSNGSGMDMEDVGNIYFNTMLTSSLFHTGDKDECGQTVSCQIHHLVHDLAVYASKSYCLNLEGEEMNIDNSDDIVHLSLKFCKGNIPKVPKDICQRLQTLFLRGGFPSNGVADFRCLRVLVVHYYRLKDLPSSIGNMKNLRYLDISRTRVEKLPASICKLYNLQTLRLYKVKQLPKAFVNLISLRHLYINKFHRSCGFGGIGQMTSLQTLPLFVVNPARDWKIEELGSLNNLKGKLIICGLSDIKSIQEARTANLCSKPGIHELYLEWSHPFKDNHSSNQILEGLEPHSNLKVLMIVKFMGADLASWINMTSKSSMVLHNLVVFKLQKCRNIKQLPTLGHLPNLQVVDISEAWKVKRIGAEFYYSSADSNTHTTIEKATSVITLFPALRTLRMSSMLALEELLLDAEQLAPSRTSPVNIFPCLEELTIDQAPKLMTIPAHDLTSLRDLNVSNICNIASLRRMTRKLTSLTSLSINNFDDSEIQFLLDELLENNLSLKELIIYNSKGLLHLNKGLEGLVSLERLEIEDCDYLTTLGDISCLVSLQLLKIIDCNALVLTPALPWLPRLRELEIGALLTEPDFPFLSSATNTAALVPSLEILKICSNKHTVKSLPDQIQHLSSLRELRLHDFGELELLPDWLGNLSSLELLELHACCNLKTMPSATTMKRLTRLRSLEISQCYGLTDRCVKGSGLDWHKISHIPFIRVARITIQSL